MRKAIKDVTPIWICEDPSGIKSKINPPKVVYHFIQYIATFDGISWMHGRAGNGSAKVKTEQELVDFLKKLNGFLDVDIWIVCLFTDKTKFLKHLESIKKIDKRKYGTVKKDSNGKISISTAGSGS